MDCSACAGVGEGEGVGAVAVPLSGCAACGGRAGAGGGGEAAAVRAARWTVLVVVLVCSTAVGAAPTALKRSRRAVIGDNELSYLMKFGYLPQSGLETGNLRTDEQLRAAIRELQSYGNIPETGEMDEATRTLLRRPRCGLPDVDGPEPQGHGRIRRFALHGRKWDYTNLTWSLETRNPRNLDPRLVRQQLGRALDVWAQNSRLTFTEDKGKRADILVYFERGYHGDGYPFDGRGQILAHAFFPGDGRGGDAHFDEEENWLLNEVSDESEGTSLFAVAAHEFGHSLGLSHSSVPGALMYPWYQGIKANFQLPDDDRNGIQQLYGAKEDRKLWGPYITSRPHRPPPTFTTTTTTTTTTRRPHVRPTKRRDYESRKNNNNNPPNSNPDYYPREDEEDKPDTCDTSYDAISVIRGEVFIFKGKYLWRIGDKGLTNEYPAETRRLWRSLPKNVSHVDAVYERNDKKIVFFIGKWYYLFDANRLERGYPRPLSHLGLPESLEKLDAAMVWGYNKKTYFFSGTMYWRFDEEVGKVELDYPRDMSMWKGVGYNIDTVFQWKDGRTYFFKGKGYWKFNDLRMAVEHEKQLPSGPMWMSCPHQLDEPDKSGYYPLGNSPRGDSEWSASSASARYCKHTVTGVILITHIIGFIRILIKFL